MAYSNITWASRPEGKDMVMVDKKTVEPLFLSLITKCTPYGYENHIVEIIKECINSNNAKNGTNHTFEVIENNMLVTVGEKPPTMFSSHMDIVGEVAKENAEVGIVDRIHLVMPTDPKKAGILYGAKFKFNEHGNLLSWTPSTLGADDKVGCWIMLKMIEQNIPGLYAFHVGEERGGIGSVLLSTKHQNKFEGLQRAIAFDRAGYGDIIDYQRGGRCCSADFVKALANDLNQYMPKYQKFDTKGVTGSFTDTANYRTLIPECTNISVGYFQQHGTGEHLDYTWMKSILLPAILKVQWDKLPTVRNPKEVTTYTYSANKNTNYGNKRKTWKEANSQTSFWELPKWHPKDGFIEEADPIVFRRAVQEYITSCNAYQDRVDFADHLMNLLELNHLLFTEVKIQEEQIELLTNKKKSGNVEDIHIKKKKRFLEELIGLSEGMNLEYENRMFQIYRETGKNFLKANKSKLIPSHFTKKELRKFNRTIFMLAYFLSLETVVKETLTELLNEIHQYITLHITEEGFDQAPFKEKHKSSLIKIHDSTSAVH